MLVEGRCRQHEMGREGPSFAAARSECNETIHAKFLILDDNYHVGPNMPHEEEMILTMRKDQPAMEGAEDGGTEDGRRAHPCAPQRVV